MAQVLTGALAIIKLNGTPIGKMKNVRVTENINRGRVSGIGELTPQELPALQWNGTVSCSFYSIEFEKDGVAGIDGAHSTVTGADQGITRNAGSIAEWVEHVLLQEEGVDLDIYKKVQDAVDTTTGLLKATNPPPFAKIEGMFLDRESFDISENNISGKDQEFTYKNPIIYV
jgi:hypothetical protein